MEGEIGFRACKRCLSTAFIFPLSAGIYILLSISLFVYLILGYLKSPNLNAQNEIVGSMKMAKEMDNEFF